MEQFEQHKGTDLSLLSACPSSVHCREALLVKPPFHIHKKSWNGNAIHTYFCLSNYTINYIGTDWKKQHHFQKFPKVFHHLQISSLCLWSHLVRYPAFPSVQNGSLLPRWWLCKKDCTRGSRCTCGTCCPSWSSGSGRSSGACCASCPSGSGRSSGACCAGGSSGSSRSGGTCCAGCPSGSSGSSGSGGSCCAGGSSGSGWSSGTCCAGCPSGPGWSSGTCCAGGSSGSSRSGSACCAGGSSWSSRSGGTCCAGCPSGSGRSRGACCAGCTIPPLDALGSGGSCCSVRTRDALGSSGTYCTSGTSCPSRTGCPRRSLNAHGSHRSGCACHTSRTLWSHCTGGAGRTGGTSGARWTTADRGARWWAGWRRTGRWTAGRNTTALLSLPIRWEIIVHNITPHFPEFVGCSTAHSMQHIGKGSLALWVGLCYNQPVSLGTVSKPLIEAVPDTKIL